MHIRPQNAATVEDDAAQEWGWVWRRVLAACGTIAQSGRSSSFCSNEPDRSRQLRQWGGTWLRGCSFNLCLRCWLAGRSFCLLPNLLSSLPASFLPSLPAACPAACLPASTYPSDPDHHHHHHNNHHSKFLQPNPSPLSPALLSHLHRHLHRCLHHNFHLHPQQWPTHPQPSTAPSSRGLRVPSFNPPSSPPA